MKIACPHCDGKFKTEAVSEWIGSAVIGVPIGLLIAAGIYEILAWNIAGIGVLILVVILFLVFPYVTKFEPADQDESKSQ